MTTKNMWQSQDPAQVSYGGTGDAALSPTYSVLCSGVTTLSPVQVVTSNGTAGQLLTSNGAGELPSWQAGPSTGDVIFLDTIVAANVASVVFNTQVTGTYNNYLIIIGNVTTGYSSASNTLKMDWSINGGSSYINNDYNSGVYYADTTPTYYNYSSTITNPISMQSYISVDLQYSAQIWLFNLYSSSMSPVYRGDFIGEQYGASGITCAGSMMGYNSGNNTINAIKFSFTSSNILTGNFSIYGIVD